MTWRRAALWSLGLAVSFAAVIAAALFWASRSELVLRWGVERYAGRLPCALVVEGLRGSLTTPVRIERVACRNADLRVEAADVQLEWSPWMLWQERVEIDRLQARTLTVSSLRPRRIRNPPADLALPLPVRVGALELGAVAWTSGGTTVALRDVSAAYEGDARAHSVTRIRLASEHGSLEGAVTLGARAPFPLSGKVRVQSGRVENWPLRATVELAGTMADAQVHAAAAFGAVGVIATFAVAPFEDDPLRSVTASIDNVDLSLVRAGLPRTAMTVELEGAGRGLEALFGRVRLANADHGSLDRDRLPLRAVDARFSASAQALRLSDARFEFGESGLAEGRASIEAGRIQLQTEVRALDLRALHSELRSTQLAGTVEVDSRGNVHYIVADLREKRVRIAARAEVGPEGVRVDHVLAQAGGAEIAASGSVDVKSGLAWRAQGQLRGFDPARFGDFPSARISGSVEAAGVVRPQWRADVRYQLSASRFRGQPLDGKGSLSLSASRVRSADAWVSLGGNRIRVRGAFGGRTDRFTFEIDAPRLATLGLGAEGRMRASGMVAGTPARPALELDGQAHALRYAGLRVERWTVRARLQQADDPMLELRMRATGAGRGELGLDEIVVDADGTLGAHAVSVVAASPQLRLSGRLEGGWASARRTWTGVIARLQGEGEYAFSLVAPARLELARGHALLGAAAVHFEQTRITLAETSLRDGELFAAGSVSGVRAARLLALRGAPAGIETSLVLGGRWSLSAGKVFEGSVELGRESGDVMIVADETLPLGLSDVSLTLRAAASRLSARFVLAGTGLAVEGEAHSLLERRGAVWGLSGAAPLTVEARAALQSIRPFAALANRKIIADGALTVEVRGEGTVAEPGLRGSIAGERIRVESVENGVFLRDGILRATFADGTLRVDQSSIRGGDGSFSATGVLATRDGTPWVELDWTAQKLAVVQHPDLRLTVSGAGKLGLNDAQLTLRGELSADRGRVELRSRTAPALGGDVVVAGREVPKPLSEQALNSELDLLLDLGPDFVMTGRGADVRLAGRVRLTNTVGTPLQAQGDISVERGTYEAYGQKLSVEKGLLRFAGPVDNPAIELRAMRKNQEVAAGVEVTGTARDPRVRLISDPEVPDPEKLSWLVLGRRVESGATTDAQTLQASAVAMAAGLGTAPLQQQLARAVGVDQITYAPSTDGTQGGVVAVGKRLSDKVYVSTQHSLSTASNTLRVSYQLSRRWSLRTESGATDAVDLFFTLSFD